MSLKSLQKKFAIKSRTGVEPFTFGSVVLDALVGGSIPRGIMLDIAGKEGSGKSTALLHALKSNASKGIKCCYIDLEGGVNKDQLIGIGVAPYLSKETLETYGIDDSHYGGEDLVHILFAETFEDCEEIIDESIKEGIEIFVIDSIQAIKPKKLLENSVSSIEPGLKSRLESSFLCKYSAIAKRHGIAMLFVSQFRTNIKFMGATTEGAGGGFAVKHYMDIRISMKQSKKMEKTLETGAGKQKVPYGSINEVWTTKCRLAPPYIKMNMHVMFGKGISNLSAYRDLLESHNMIQGSRGFFTIKLGDREVKARGEHGLLQKLAENASEVVDLCESLGGIRLVINSDNEVGDEDDE